MDPRQTGTHVPPAKRFAPQTRCPNGTCVEIEGTGEGFVLTNSTPGIDGSVAYTPAEMATFVKQVKDGVWDDLIA